MFRQVFDLLNQGDTLLLTFTREGDSLRVNVIPKATPEAKASTLLPLSILANPAELDDPTNGFGTVISSYQATRQGVLEAISEIEASGKTVVAEAKAKAAPGKDAKAKSSAKPVEVKPTKPVEPPVVAPWAKPSSEVSENDGQVALFSSAPTMLPPTVATSITAPAIPQPDLAARRAVLERDLESLRGRLETNAQMLGFANAFTDGVLNAQLAAFPLGAEYNAKRAELEMLGGSVSVRRDDGPHVIANANPEWPAIGQVAQEDAA